jgi:hypothetical protein
MTLDHDPTPPEPLVPVTLNLPPNAIFPSGGAMVIEIAASLADLIEKAEQTGRAPYIKQADAELNAAIIRLREESLPGDKRRTWKDVRDELKRINPKWKFKSAEAVRKRYTRNKRIHGAD